MNQLDSLQRLFTQGDGFKASALWARGDESCVWPVHQSYYTTETLENISAEIFSYNTLIALVSKDDKKVYLSACKYSRTTSKQSTYIRRKAEACGYAVVMVDIVNDFQPIHD